MKVKAKVKIKIDMKNKIFEVEDDIRELKLNSKELDIILFHNNEFLKYFAVFVKNLVFDKDKEFKEL
jgi:hypothetical protein